MGFRSSLLRVPNIDSVGQYCSTPHLYFDEVEHELQVVFEHELQVTRGLALSYIRKSLKRRVEHYCSIYFLPLGRPKLPWSLF